MFKFIFKLENKEIDLSQSLINIRIDSLMAIKLRR